jgi:solute:Na+ symporter, SSS family
MNSISWIDTSIIVLFLVFTITYALNKRKNKDEVGYFLAGKNENWFVVGLSLFAASVSSTTLIGNSSEGFISGITVFNYNIGSVFVMIFIAVFFIPFYIKTGIYTIPEYLKCRYDRRSSTYFSFITIVGNIFLDAAAALYTGALILKVIFPELNTMHVIWIIALIAGFYTIVGGLSSAIHADIIHSFVLIIGSIILSFYCMHEIGGWNELMSRFNDGVWMSLIRPASDPTMPWIAIIVSLPILGFYFWGNNQIMVQRILSAKTIDHGRKGLLFVAFIYLFTLFIFILPGVIARGINIFGIELPKEIISGETLRNTYGINTNEVYPRLIMKLLPVGMMGILLAAMISALTSALCGTLNSVSTLFTMDFYRHFNKKADGKQLVKVGQITSFVALIIAVLWAPFIGKFSSLVSYYQEFISYIAPPVVSAFLLGLFWKRSNSHGAFAGLIAGLVVALVVTCFKYGFHITIPIHFLLWAPILFIISSSMNIIVSLMTRKPSVESIEKNTWNKTLFIEDLNEHKAIVWYKNFYILAFLLIIFTIIEYIIFW